MTFYQAEQLANDLMRHFGLLEKGWTFRWSNGKRRLGSAGWVRNRRTGECMPNKLTMSKYLVQLNGADESYVPLADQAPGDVPGHIEDVIRHECAHMIAGHEAAHGPLWKAAAVPCGARPNRLADKTVKVVKAPWEIVCLGCNKKVGERFRRIKPETLHRKYHPKCGKSLGQLICRRAA